MKPRSSCSEVLGLYLRAEQRHGVTVPIFRDMLTGKDVLAGRDIDKALREAQEHFLAERRARLAEVDLRRAETRRAEAAQERALAERRARLAEVDLRRAEIRRAEAAQERALAERRARLAEVDLRKAETRRAQAAQQETKRYKQVIEELKRKLQSATTDNSQIASEKAE